MGSVGSNLTNNKSSMDEVRAKINETIASNCIVMYSKPGCPFCTMATKVFKDMKVDFLEINLNGGDLDTSLYQDVLREMTGARSVPRVFVGGKCIGGGSETKQLYSSGQLQKMIGGC